MVDSGVVQDVILRQAYNTPRKVESRVVNYADIIGTTPPKTYQLIDAGGNYLTIPARAVPMAVYMIVTTTFTSGGAATIECGWSGGTEDDDNIFWDTTMGAVANFVARSIVGAPQPSKFPVIVADGEIPLLYDTLARKITLKVATAALTAGEGILVVEYVAYDKVKA